MTQAKTWVRSVLAVLVVGAMTLALVQGVGQRSPVKVAGDDPKIYKGG